MGLSHAPSRTRDHETRVALSQVTLQFSSNTRQILVSREIITIFSKSIPNMESLLMNIGLNR